jgi:mono/diheme cytochrome c family protein
MWALLLFILVLAPAACRGEQEGKDLAAIPPSPKGDASRGLGLIAKFECARCHDGALMGEVPREKHCVRCHQDILAGRFQAPENVLAEWRGRVRHLSLAPSLVASAKHYRRDWIERFLLEPYDVRPHLTPMMPRLAITPEEARDIATALAISDDASAVSFRGADAARGKELLAAKGCRSCHLFTGAPPLADRPPVFASAGDRAEVAAPQTAPPALAPAVALAPDLRTTRDRLRPDGLVAWLMDPAGVKPGTLMPSASLTPEEARDIALYLLTAPLTPLKAEPIPDRLPVLDRPVTYEEVSRRVLRKTCWHCHSEPDYAIGEGGPGNTGGFGFKGRGLSLADYDGVASGLLDERGERQSVFAKGPDGTPLLVRALLARQEELAGRATSASRVRGMPLGLPALPPEEIQLVETWIAQGRPE